MSYKKFLGIALCLFPLVASAKVPYGMAGCGLGSLLFNPDSGQLFASTTNQTSYNQAFGISAGTSNCMDSSKASALNAQQQFMSSNYALLAKEMAQGDGETLRAFSSTFGCAKEAYPNFATQMQKSYSKIFAVSGEMAALGVVEDEIKGNETLSQACSLVI